MNSVKAVDLGTAFIVGITSDVSGKNVIRSVRNCFVDLDDLNVDINWVKENTPANIVQIQDDDGNISSFIIGDEAINLPIGKVRRPMKSGLVNPNEDLAITIISKIIEMVIGPSDFPGQIVCYSSPAATSDNKLDPVNHSRIAKKIFEDLGYEAIEISEALAVIYANCPKVIDENGKEYLFSGIGLSFGGGMCNITHTYLGIPTPELTFSLPRSGDWIDNRVSESMGDKENGDPRFSPSYISGFKERYLDLLKEDYTDAELIDFGFTSGNRRKDFRKIHFALRSYYEDLINFSIASFCDKFKRSRVESDYAVEIVISGGTSLPHGFPEKFDAILRERGDFPFEISRVRRAEDPLNATCLGALTKAKSEAKKRLKNSASEEHQNGNKKQHAKKTTNQESVENDETKD